MVPPKWILRVYWTGFLLRDLTETTNNKETILFTIDPYHGNPKPLNPKSLNKNPLSPYYYYYGNPKP